MDVADAVREIVGQTDFPEQRDIDAWIQMNRTSLEPLWGEEGWLGKSINARTILRLWREAQTLLLGLLCRDVDSVGFVMGLEQLTRAARKSFNRCAEFSGDLFRVSDGASAKTYIARLEELRRRIAKFRTELSAQRPSWCYGQGAGTAGVICHRTTAPSPGSQEFEEIFSRILGKLEKVANAEPHAGTVPVDADELRVLAAITDESFELDSETACVVIPSYALACDGIGKASKYYSYSHKIQKELGD